MAASADLAFAGLADMIKRIEDDESVLVPHKTLRGLVAALDIVLAVYANASPSEATAPPPSIRLMPSPKGRGRT